MSLSKKKSSRFLQQFLFKPYSFRTFACPANIRLFYCKMYTPCAKNKLCQPGQTITQQRGSLKFTKWHDKRDVAFLSTNVSPEEPSRTVQRKKNGRNIDVQKPHVSDVYTANMERVDRADQFHSYYTVGRQFGFFLMLLPVMAIFLNVSTKEVAITGNKHKPLFVELGKCLINGYNCQK